MLACVEAERKRLNAVWPNRRREAQARKNAILKAPRKPDDCISWLVARGFRPGDNNLHNAAVLWDVSVETWGALTIGHTTRLVEWTHIVMGESRPSVAIEPFDEHQLHARLVRLYDKRDFVDEYVRLEKERHMYKRARVDALLADPESLFAVNKDK